MAGTMQTLHPACAAFASSDTSLPALHTFQTLPRRGRQLDKGDIQLHRADVCCCVQVRALRTIAAVCTLLLSQWSSVPQEDQEALSLGMDSAGQPLSSDMKLAMQFRLGKKRLLLHTVSEISKQIQASSLPPHAAMLSSHVDVQ